VTEALLGAACGLLLIGGVGGHALHWFSRADADRARNWGTWGPLAAALAAAIAVTFLAIRQLAACSAELPSCARPVTVLSLPAPTNPMPTLDLILRVDAIAAVFLLLVGACGTCIAVYSFGWLRRDGLRNRVAGSFNLFLLAMILVIVVGNIFWLFVGLELMTFCSSNLVRYRGDSGGPVAASRTAVRTYLIVSHLGLISLLVGVLPIVVWHHSLDMTALNMKYTHGDISIPAGSPSPTFSFSFILLGLAMRAGVTPFHFWVPTVHPQLPTNTHAMVSAVMLKIPVYLMIRFFLGGIVGPVQWWWGAVVLVLAAVTTVVTVFYAMLSADLKVALAFHSVENIGIILIGLGLALLFSGLQFHIVRGHQVVYEGVRAAASLALVASLYHVLNHGIFKSLLFLCIGSIERRTGTVELRRLGGLCRALPWTGFSFLAGAAAIAELPPLNGFISGWLTLQALFSGWQVYLRHSNLSPFVMPVLIAALVAFAVALGCTALAFVKISGQALLGEPRGAPVAGREPRSMRTIMAVLAGLCLLLGLQPWLLVPWLSSVLKPLRLASPRLIYTPGMLDVQTGTYHAKLPITPLLLLVGSAAVLTALLRTWRWARRPVWVGGTELDPATMQYSGNAVSALLWEQISRWRRSGPTAPSGYVEDLSRQRDRPAKQFREEVRLSPRRSVPDLANLALNRLISRIISASYRIGNRLQNGDVRSYLAYMLVVVLLVLIVLAVVK